MRYNPDVDLKTRGDNQRAWERFEKTEVSPHFHFLEGTKQNNKLENFVQKEVAAGRM
jgi:hypothetical protein